MSEKYYEPLTITSNFSQLGTPAYPAYLSLGEDAMIIEGGIGATSSLVANQLKAMDIQPERIKYIALTHTHPDHIGAVINWKKIWPHVQIIASPVATTLLKSEELSKEFTRLDTIISEILLIKGEIEEWPPVIEYPVFNVDLVLKEGEKVDLGKGVTWTVYETPGHSPCHTSYYNHSQEILTLGDATGLYDPQKDLFWPNYFESLEAYCNSIRKLYTLHARYGVLSHNGVITGDIRNHLRKAMAATEKFHNGMLQRVSNGEDPKKVAYETAKWVYTFTNMQPFETIYGLSRLMIKRSQAVADIKDLFTLP
jgi:glyoxylase-like metal-dependent hydrolase (beta-lactamase superfamily II)